MFHCIRDYFYSAFNVGAANRYRFDGRIFGSSEAIHCLAVSGRGEILAAGDSDGTRLWNLKSRREIETPPPVEAARGPVTALSWCPRVVPAEVDDILCFGTMFGHLVIWHKMDKEENFDETASKCISPGEEIMTIAVEIADSGTLRIAAGSTCGSVQVWAYDSKDHILERLFRTQLASTTPKTIAFEQNLTRDIYVFGLYDGVVNDIISLTLKGSDGSLVSARPATNMIGSAAIDIRRRVVAVDNCETGVDLFNLESLKLIRHFPTGRSTRVFPLQVALAEDSKVVVSGSSKGAVYVFDRKTGRPIDVLHHTAEDGMVQTVATYEQYDVSYIISASSGEDNIAPFIAIWRCNRKKMRGIQFTKWLLVLFVGVVAIVVAISVDSQMLSASLASYLRTTSFVATVTVTSAGSRTRTVYFTGPTITRTFLTTITATTSKNPHQPTHIQVSKAGVGKNEVSVLLEGFDD